MRLTLRTLLAYLSEVLEPADAQQLQEKIERSSFARKLSERIPRLIEHRDLACPKVDSRSSGADPNTVSEYIDGLLAPERMAEFDRVCLDSDTRLAEVASCFQVLTVVLGKPAKVSPSLRDRVYQIGADRRREQGESPAHELSVQDRIAMSEEYVDAPVLKPAKSHFPAPGDELRADLMEKDDVDAEDELPEQSLTVESSSVESRSVAAVESDPPPIAPSPMDVLTDESDTPPADDEQVVRVKDLDEDDPAGARIAAPRPGLARRLAPVAVLVLSLVVVGGALVMALGPDTILGRAGTKSETNEPSDQAGTETNETDADDESGELPIPDSDTDPASGDDEDSPSDAMTDNSADGVPSADGETAAEPANAADTNPAPDNGGATTNDDTTVGSDNGDRELIPLTVSDGAPDVSEDPPFVAGGEPIGTVATSGQIIARRDPEQAVWFRLPLDAPVLARDRLLSFPMFRPRLTIADDWAITLVGASGIEFNGIEENRLEMELSFGACSVATNGATTVETRITAAGVTGTATLADSNSMVAVQIQYYMPPGADPLAGARLVFVDIVAARGRVIWEDDNHVSVLDEGQARRYESGTLVENVTLSQVPAWPHSGVEGIDRMAVEAVDEIIGADQPLMREFRRLLNDQRVEVRMLAGQCLSLLGDHSVVIRALNDPRNKSYWKRYIEGLHETMARHSDQAMDVWAATQEVAGNDAAAVFRMLSQYSDEQLQAGGAEQLVGSLSEPSLTLRVLAIDNLRRVTGTHMMYRPDSAERIRSKYFDRWKERLANGQISYVDPPQPPAIDADPSAH